MKISPEDYTAMQSPRLSDTRLSRLRSHLDHLKMDVQDIVITLQAQGLPSSPKDVKTALEEKNNPSLKEERADREKASRLLVTWFDNRLRLLTGKTHTSVNLTRSKVEKFDPGVLLDDITPSWLKRFDNYMALTSPSPNARAVHMRNLRAVINYAIDEDATANYPFRRFHIKTMETAKRSLPVESLRKLIFMEVESWQREYRDMFVLSFLLMGINFADLLNLEHSSVVDGRIVFNRSKTKKLYSMKLEPEALEIIDRWRGHSRLLCPMDRYGWHENYLKRCNRALRSLGVTLTGKRGAKEGKPLFPEISTYWARHSWATIAASLDIPKDTIAVALGHEHGNRTTGIYIDYYLKKVDIANRRVIDWVLYGKLPPGVSAPPL